MDNEKDVELLVVRAQAGHKEAIEELLIRYHQLILKISKRYYLRDGEKEDLLQEGRIAFCEAVMNYNVERSEISLESFLYICITRKMNTCIRKANSIKNKFLNDAISNNSLLSETDPSVKVIDTVPFEGNPEDIYIFNEEKTQYFNEISQKFPKEFLEIIDLRVQGFSYREISERLDISPKSIDNSLQKLRKKKFFMDNNL